MINPIFVAIDTPHMKTALDLVNSLAGHVGGVKLGLEFFCANGLPGISDLSQLGIPIFLDLKLHDIPNTVAGALKSTVAIVQQ